MKGPNLTHLAVAVVLLAQGALQASSDEHSKPDEDGRPMPTDRLQSQHNTQYVPKIVNANFPLCHSLSYFPNAPWKPGLVLEGGPCRRVNSMDCEGFGCGPGICFPVTTLNCCKYIFLSCFYASFQTSSVNGRKDDMKSAKRYFNAVRKKQSTVNVPASFETFHSYEFLPTFRRTLKMIKYVAVPIRLTSILRLLSVFRAAYRIISYNSVRPCR